MTDPGRYRIVGARVDAWFAALQQERLVVVEHEVDPDWADPPGIELSWSDRLIPVADGGLPVLISRSRFGGVDAAGCSRAWDAPRPELVWFHSADATRATAARRRSWTSSTSC